MARKCYTTGLARVVCSGGSAHLRHAEMLVAALNLPKPLRPLKIAPSRRRVEIVMDSGPETQSAEPVKIRHGG